MKNYRKFISELKLRDIVKKEKQLGLSNVASFVRKMKKEIKREKSDDLIIVRGPDKRNDIEKFGFEGMRIRKDDPLLKQKLKNGFEIVEAIDIAGQANKRNAKILQSVTLLRKQLEQMKKNSEKQTKNAKTEIIKQRWVGINITVSNILQDVEKILK